jgi:hypothetical protein
LLRLFFAFLEVERKPGTETPAVSSCTSKSTTQCKETAFAQKILTPSNKFFALVQLYAHAECSCKYACVLAQVRNQSTVVHQQALLTAPEVLLTRIEDRAHLGSFPARCIALLCVHSGRRWTVYLKLVRILSTSYLIINFPVHAIFSSALKGAAWKELK